MQKIANVFLYLLTINILNQSPLFASLPKDWFAMKDEEMDYSVPLIFDGERLVFLKASPEVEEEKIVSQKVLINKNTPTPKTSLFRVIQKKEPIPNDRPQVAVIKRQMSPFVPAYEPRIKVKDELPPLPQTLIPHKRTRIEIMPRKVPDQIIQEIPKRPPEKVVLKKPANHPIIQIKDLGDTLKAHLNNMWEPAAMNILLIEVDGPLFSISPISELSHYFLDLALKINPALCPYFDTPDQKFLFYQWVVSKTKAGAFRAYIQTDPALIKVINDLKNTFEIKFLSELSFSDRHKLLLNIAPAGIDIPNGPEDRIKELKDAGFSGGSYFRNGKMNQFMESMGSMLSHYRKIYPDKYLNFIHLHTFANEEYLTIFKKIYSGFDNDCQSLYRSIVFNPEKEAYLHRVFRSEKILDHLENDFLIPQRESYFHNFPLLGKN